MKAIIHVIRNLVLAAVLNLLVNENCFSQQAASIETVPSSAGSPSAPAAAPAPPPTSPPTSDKNLSLGAALKQLDVPFAWVAQTPGDVRSGFEASVDLSYVQVNGIDRVTTAQEGVASNLNDGITVLWWHKLDSSSRWSLRASVLDVQIRPGGADVPVQNRHLTMSEYAANITSVVNPWLDVSYSFRLQDEILFQGHPDAQGIGLRSALMPEFALQAQARLWQGLTTQLNALGELQTLVPSRSSGESLEWGGGYRGGFRLAPLKSLTGWWAELSYRRVQQGSDNFKYDHQDLTLSLGLNW
jgi:hypothetical protein